jgi:hypothetical protein
MPNPSPITEQGLLIGTWKLISCEAHLPDGEVKYPYGKNPIGMLVYDPSGHMCIMMMRRGRPNFSSDDPLGGNPEEIRSAYEGFDAYCGTYEIDRKGQIVIHHLEGSKFPNWVETDKVKFFELAQDRLVLSTTPIMAGDEQWVVRSMWSRVL